MSKFNKGRFLSERKTPTNRMPKFHQFLISDVFHSSSLTKIPAVQGVYFFLSQDKEILYIGYSKNIQQRMRTHWREGFWKERDYYEIFILEGCNSSLEEMFIQEIKTPYNGESFNMKYHAYKKIRIKSGKSSSKDSGLREEILALLFNENRFRLMEGKNE